MTTLLLTLVPNLEIVLEAVQIATHVSVCNLVFFPIFMADLEHPRPPYQHHAGFYRMIMPEDDFKPWEWSPVTDHSLPESPMRPIFQIPKAFPPGLSGPVPSPTMMVMKIPTNGCKKGGLWAAIRRFLRICECRWAILAHFSTIWYIAFVSQSPVATQQDYADTDTPPLSKVQPNEWKQYGYWARPILNNVECPNSRESSFSIELYHTKTYQLSTVRLLPGPSFSNISSTD